jgi:hypothetical protein
VALSLPGDERTDPDEERTRRHERPACPAGRSLERLFAPGIRLGWTFRDRDPTVTPYSEPAPDPDLLHKNLTERVAVAQSPYTRARR